jgi:hypothetical protein
MIKFILILLTGVVTSFYFFPFEFAFLPTINTKMMVAAVGGLIAVWQAVSKQSVAVSKDFFVASIFAGVFSFITFCAIVYNNTSDYSYTFYIISFFVWFFAAYATCCMISQVHGNISVKLVINYLVGVCAFQCIMALLIDFVPAVKLFVDSYVVQLVDTDLDKIQRLYGIGAALDMAGIRFSAVLVMIAVLICNYYTSGMRVSDSGLRASDSGLRASDSGLRASDSGLRVSDSGMRASDSGLRVSDSGMRASDSGMRVSDSGMKASDSGLSGSDSGLRVSDSGLRASDSGLRVSDSGLRVSDIRLNRKSVAVYGFFFVLISVVGSMIARTTYAGMVLAVGYIIFKRGVWRPRITYTNLRFWGVLIGIVLALTLINVYFYNHAANFRAMFRFGFEGFINWVETGKWQTSSTDILQNMVVFPESLKTWIIGDGFMTDPITRTYYMRTDIGYLRFIFYCGTIGLLAFLSMFIYLTVACYTKYPQRDKQLFLLLFILVLANWAKVTTDIFLVYALFMCIPILQKQTDKA